MPDLAPGTSVQNTVRERAARRALVADLFTQGYSQTEIAERVGVTTRTIKRDMQQIADQWRNEYVEQWQDMVVLELRKLAAHETRLQQEVRALAYRDGEFNTDSEQLPDAIQRDNLIAKLRDQRFKLLGITPGDVQNVFIQQNITTHGAADEVLVIEGDETEFVRALQQASGVVIDVGS